MTSNDPVKFALKSIRVEEFATGKREGIELSGVRLQNEFAFGLNIPDHVIQVTHKVVFEFQERPFVTLQVRCGFDVEPTDFARIATPQDNQVKIPQAIMLHFCNITTGTARGILHAKLDDTEFSEYMLPIINLEQMVKSDVVFMLDPAPNV